MPTDRALLRRLSKTRELNTLPQVVHLALSMLDAEKHGAREACEVITQDPALTARVLKIANSVMFNPSTDRVCSAQDAVARIGFDEVRRIVITVGVIESMMPRRGAFDYEAYWRHCIATGLIAELVAEASPVVSAGPGESRGAYFAGGLLHDIGVLPMVGELGTRYTKVFAQAERKKLRLAEIEHKRFGVSHCDVGGALAEEWRIAGAIGEAARCHDDPERAAQPDQTYVRVVHVANWLAGEFGHGLLPSDCRGPFHDDVWCKLALSRSDIPQLRSGFMDVRDRSRLFSMMRSVSPPHD